MELVAPCWRRRGAQFHYADHQRGRPFSDEELPPADDKQTIVVLREEDYDAWLAAPAERSMDFMRQCRPEDLIAVASPAAPRK